MQKSNARVDRFAKYRDGKFFVRPVQRIVRQREANEDSRNVEDFLKGIYHRQAATYAQEDRISTKT